MTHWFVYDAEGVHRGPLSTAELLRAILGGEVAEDAWLAEEAWFAPPGSFGWRQAAAIPEIAGGLSPRSSQPPSLRVVRGAFTPRLGGDPDFGATVMMIPIEDPKGA